MIKAYIECDPKDHIEERDMMSEIRTLIDRLKSISTGRSKRLKYVVKLDGNVLESLN